MPEPVKTIGLTGGIGSGKSTVAQILSDLGARVINADAVGHDIYLPQSEGWRRVTQAFGDGILKADQTIDRQKLGAIVFNDAQALARLNAIVHPLIYDEVRRRIAAQRAAGFRGPIVLEAAVLIEANWLPLVDEVWLVAADQSAVIDRVARQRGLSPDEVATRVAAQLSDAERRRFVHVVLENTGSIDALRSRVEDAWRRTTRSP
jgi:dephospho-CoA kinase